MGLPLAQEKYTYKDYCGWDDDTRWELIDGVAYDMSPSPSVKHQNVLLQLAGEFREFFKDKTCAVYISPLDVRLPEGDENEEDTGTVVQPDLFVVCDPSKIDDRGCLGAPDLVVEILSPSTAGKDLNEKKELYRKHGVKEYWVVMPYEECIQVFLPGKDGKYSLAHVFADDNIITSALFPGMAIQFKDVFVKPKEKESKTKEKPQGKLTDAPCGKSK
ncbi:MAG: Uma2 family endonuclease [Spirochaetales bacterium]|nr:Uma2 family endonuclease [Spirochaetales bacterium]